MAMTRSSASSGRGGCDIAIIGAGPVGLSLALSLRGCGLDVRLLERQSEDRLVNPDYDGREIALSLRSVGILKGLGAWRHIEADNIAPLRSARVVNGQWDKALHFDAGAVGEDKLGVFVANSNIRRALYAEQAARGEAELITGAEVVGLRAGLGGGHVTLKDGRRIEADLIVAADTRFSAARRMAGITASRHDFGQSMIVTKVRFQHPHDHVAWECFLPGGSLAILPLNDHAASLVQTFAPAEARHQMSLDLERYLDAANLRLEHRFGQITSLSRRFTYPLVGVYANAFARPGFALVGDAAVGMHPITAHGFNLGVQGQSVLAGHIRRALKGGRSPADPNGLTAYERDHRRLSGGLYRSTLAIAELSARESLPARLTRQALLDAGRLLPAARKRIVKSLTQPLTDP